MKQHIGMRRIISLFLSVGTHTKCLLESMISDKSLLNSVKQARKDYKEEKTVVAESMSELI